MPKGRNSQTLSGASRTLAALGAEQGLVGANVEWLDLLRGQGLTRLRERGLPTPKMEAWKYTSLRPLDEFALSRPVGGVAAAGLDETLAGLGPLRLVFVNGLFDAEASDLFAAPSDAMVLPLSAALESDADRVRAHLGCIAEAGDDPLAALNSAFVDDGIVLLMNGGVADAPIVVEHVATAASDGVACHPRNLIVLEKGARATLVERFSGAGRYLTNPLSEIVVEDGAHLTHVRLFEDSGTAANLSHLHARVGRDAHYETWIVSTGGMLLRDEIEVDLAAPGADASLSGVYLGRERQHTDHTTIIRHQVPHTTSRETFKGALDGAARAVFQGCIYVAKGANGTDGQMSNKTLLLSDKAEIDSKPQLLIYADDVKCAHGATAGELEEDSLFYLRARGIPEREARAMLVEGFLDEVFDGVADPVIADLLRARISVWLAADGLKEAA